MLPTDAGPLNASTRRGGHALANHEPIVAGPAPVTSWTRRPTLGRPALSGALSGGTPDRAVDWRGRITSVASQRPTTARTAANWSPRLISRPAASHDDRTTGSREPTRAGEARRVADTLDRSRPPVTRGPERQPPRWHNAAYLTKRQLQFIRALARECDVEADELEQHSWRLFGAGVDSLSRDSAKTLIDRLARALDAVA